MGASVSVDIFARDRGASSNLRQVGDTAEHSGERLRKMGQMAKAGGLAVAAGVGLATAAALKLAQGAAEDEKAALQLATSLRTNADATDGQVAATEKWITAQGKALGVTDDQLRPAMAQLATATGDVSKAQRLASIAMNVSAGRHIALASVTKALERAQNGNVTSLGKLGVKTKDADGKTRSLRDITRDLAATYRGQASSAAESTAGRFERLKVRLDETGESIGYRLLPMFNELGDWIYGEGIPGAEKLWRAYQNNGIDGVVAQIEDLTGTQGRLSPIVDEVEEALDGLWRITKEVGGAFLDASADLPAFLSPLKAIGEITGAVADVLEAIPDPLKAIGVEAAIAALILPRFSGAVTGITGSVGMNIARLQQWRAEMTYTETRAGATATAVGKIGGAAKMAAGVGGMLLLTQGMQETDRATSTLMTTLGGAATGFAVGGPWGALVGGAAGLAMGVFSHKTDDAAESMKVAGPAAADFAASLDDVTGAATQGTRSLIYLKLQQSGAFDQARQLGISQRDLVQSMLGNDAASRRVAQATRLLRDEINLTGAAYAGGATLTHTATKADQEHNAAATGLRATLGLTTDAIKTESAAIRQRTRATQDLTVLQGKIPRKIVSQLEQRGIAPTLRDLARVRQGFGSLTRKEFRAVIRAVGVDASVRDVDKVVARMRGVGARAVPNFQPARRSFASFYSDAEGVVSRGGVQITRKMRDGTRGAKADLSAYQRSITTGNSTARAAASTGGRQVGVALMEGVISGFSPTRALLSSQAAAAVGAAIAAARARAKIKSPSQEMHYVGKMMGLGAEQGLRASKRGLSQAGVELIRDLVAGIGKEKVKADRVLAAIAKEVERTKDRVQKLKDSRAGMVSDFLGFQSSVFSAPAPTNEDGSQGVQTLDSMLTFAAAERDKAKQVQAAVNSLTDRGLSGDLIKQLRSQGAAGIDQLLTLSTASQAQIAQFNALNAQTTGAYTATGLELFQDQSGAAQLAQAERDERLAKAVAKAVHDAMTKREAEYEFVIRGDTLVAVLRRNDRDKGKK